MPTKPRFASIEATLLGPENSPTALEVIRTTTAAMVALLLARQLHLPNPYWATISCLIVVLSASGSELAVSVQRCIGTGIGAALAALSDHFLGSSPWSFGATVLAFGTACWAARINLGAFRYGSIAAAIVILVPHDQSAAVVAIHRFIEVSLGIGVGLATALMWPAKRPMLKS
jgi:uncharacterized membrane protein YgaE (UPF0421/DUF939 family)